MSEAQQDNGSPILKKFQVIAVRCVSRLREVSDAGAVLSPADIATVQAAIVKEIDTLYFSGLVDDEELE
jgi:hypothetical protein